MKQSLIILMLMVLVGSFNNCSDVNFSKVTDSTTIVDPREVGEIIASCKNALADGSMKVAQSTLTFKDTGVESGRPGNICEFGVGDNLPIKDGVLRARYDQVENLVLPAGAVLCDLDLSASVQSFKYDDVFFFTLNGTLMATNNAVSMSGLKSTSVSIPNSNSTYDFYDYDWLGVRDTPFQNDHRDDYCLGAAQGKSTCQWPLTEQSGQISFKFDNEILVALTAAKTGMTNSFGFTITGDNDQEVDCYHQRLDLTVKASYYVP